MDGILPLYKERGMTSHDCVFKLRKILKTKKIGHSGTLDPNVDGVLPICVGRATKAVEFLVSSGKSYVGEITLGFSTTTEDSDGETVATTPVLAPLTREQIDQAMLSFVGEIKQIPPMYSAVKVNGRRLYDYARAGETVERPERIAQITAFKRTSEPVFNAKQKTQSWRFTVDCGKGTYIRTLAVDLGRQLGYAAHMSDLTRVKSGGFTIEQAVSLTQVAELMAENQLEKVLLPIDYALTDFKRLILDETLYSKVKNGAVLPKSLFAIDHDQPVLLIYQAQIIALYEPHPTKKLFYKPQKMFAVLN